jgi:hypothetical protein
VVSVNAELDEQEDYFITSESGEKITYDGEYLTVRDMIRKTDKLQERRSEFYKLNLLCILT